MSAGLVSTDRWLLVCRVSEHRAGGCVSAGLVSTEPMVLCL